MLILCLISYSTPWSTSDIILKGPIWDVLLTFGDVIIINIYADDDAEDGAEDEDRVQMS